MTSLNKKMGRKCSHCGTTGHNSRTCPTQRRINEAKMKLFGVQLLDQSSSNSSSFYSHDFNKFSMKKSFSMDCLSVSPFINYTLSGSRRPSCLKPPQNHHQAVIESSGYLSDGLIDQRTQEKKKGMPWTEEEHRTFLAGLEKLGRGDWRGISRNFVTTRTPTQVASHAQKYFLRQNTLNNKKTNRRPSLFDMVERDKFAIQSHHRDRFSLTIEQGYSISGGMLLQTAASSSAVMNSSSSSPEQDSKSSQTTQIEHDGNQGSSASPPPNLELTLAVPNQTPVLNQRKPISVASSCLLTVV